MNDTCRPGKKFLPRHAGAGRHPGLHVMWIPAYVGMTKTGPASGSPEIAVNHGRLGE